MERDRLEQMKMIYVTPYDANDIKSWSGTGSFMRQALENQGLEMQSIGPLHAGGAWKLRLKYQYYRRIFGKKYMGEVDTMVLKDYSRDAERKMAGMIADLVFAPHADGVAYLKTDRPVVLWVDCTFGGMVDFYPDYCDLCAESLRDGNQMERLALGRAKLVIFASEWAAQTAVKLYGMDPGKSAVVPFGANIVCDRTMADIERFVATRPKGQCNLLFIGRVWERKGGDLAINVARKLHEAGLEVKLTLVGSRPPGGEPLPDYVEALGFVSKATEEGRKKIDDLLAEAHFLIVPSRAEAYGIVFCEASSFGVPSLATNVGGIPTVVRGGRNGMTFPLTAAADEYARYILELMENRSAYRELARSTFNEYATRLNWNVAGAQVRELLRRI